MVAGVAGEAVVAAQQVRIRNRFCSIYSRRGRRCVRGAALDQGEVFREAARVSVGQVLNVDSYGITSFVESLYVVKLLI